MNANQRKSVAKDYFFLFYPKISQIFADFLAAV